MLSVEMEKCEYVSMTLVAWSAEGGGVGCGSSSDDGGGRGAVGWCGCLFTHVCRRREAVCRRLRVTHTTHASSGERLMSPLTVEAVQGEGFGERIYNTIKTLRVFTKMLLYY